MTLQAGESLRFCFEAQSAKSCSYSYSPFGPVIVMCRRHIFHEWPCLPSLRGRIGITILAEQWLETWNYGKGESALRGCQTICQRASTSDADVVEVVVVVVDS